jgi:Leucine-rich repeat (LRR) protein
MPDSESPHGIAAVPAGPFSPAAKPARRNRWRLRMLLAINGILAVLFVITQLEPNQVAMLGPPGQYLHELFNPPAVPETSPLGKRLIADVTAVGGRADVMVRSRPYLGLVGNTEQFSISFTGTGFDDRALERLVNRYGDRIWGLDLRHTNVTDDGLRHLVGLSQLADLSLGHDNVTMRKVGPVGPRPISTITDAGLIHLNGLRQLRNLNLGGLPITDAGLDAIKDMPAFDVLCLSRTKINGPGLARLKSLPMLTTLDLGETEIDDEGLVFLTGASNLQYLSLSRTKIKGPGLSRLTSLPMLTSLILDDSEIDDQGLSLLAGAPSLQTLSLNGVPLTAKGLKAIAGLPRLGRLSLNRSGLLDEDVMSLRISKPALKIERR